MAYGYGSQIIPADFRIRSVPEFVPYRQITQFIHSASTYTLDWNSHFVPSLI
ncbi:MAG: hypothetical protein EZS28_004902, partial [Streblomastix strix]